MLLYDDCEKLLEVKMLKKDEQVSCGETLTFNSFLVDVNDAVSADGGDDRKPLVNLNEKRAKPFVNTTSSVSKLYYYYYYLKSNFIKFHYHYIR